MKQAKLKEAVLLAQRLHRTFVATSSADGMPHVAVASSLSLSDQNVVVVRDWFCPGTVANASGGHGIALVVWDPELDKGYQLLGAVEEVQELAMMNGYSPKEEQTSMPQVQRALHVRVGRILVFTQAPHTDVE